MFRFIAGIAVFLGLSFAQGKKWTVCVFLNGDNNLEEAGVDDINEMESEIDTTKYNVYVLFDRTPGYDNSNGNWEGTRLYRILPDANMTTINSQLIKDCGELNMGDPDNVIWFLDTVRLLSQTDCYWIIIWNHGSGWDKRGPDKGVSYDDTDNDYISVAGGELRYLADSIFGILDRNLSILSYDACLMGLLEVEYEVKDFTDVSVHSEETEPWDGYPYETLMQWLNDHPNASPQELGHNFASIYVESYKPGGTQYDGSSNITHSAVDQGPWFTRYYLAVDRFSRELIKAGGKNQAQINACYQNAQRYSDSDLMDLYDFADSIAKTPSLPANLRAAAQAVVDIQGDGSVYNDTALIGSFWYDNDDSWGSVSGSHGIAIYAPTSSPSSEWRNLCWAKNSSWWWFINGSTSLPNQPILTYYSNSIGDSLPYGPSSFTITLINSGGQTASGVSATLSSPDPYVTITQNASSYPDMPSEGTGTSNASYQVTLNASCPLGHRVPFFLSISAGSYNNTSSFNMIAGAGADICEDPCEAITNTALLPFQNPVRGKVKVEFALSGRASASLKAYDATGRLVATLFSGRSQGIKSVAWEPEPGAYFLRLEEGEVSRTQKLVVTR
ncbi:MAG: clostripain-related cysteine peptidase [candidate division WOR-3 bacterium]